MAAFGRGRVSTWANLDLDNFGRWRVLARASLDVDKFGRGRVWRWATLDMGAFGRGRVCTWAHLGVGEFGTAKKVIRRAKKEKNKMATSFCCKGFWEPNMAVVLCATISG